MTAREHLDPESPAAHLFHDFAEAVGRALHDVELLRPRRRQAPLDLGLGDDVRRITDGGGGDHCRTTGLRQEPASLEHHALLDLARPSIAPRRAIAERLCHER
jgi:hypothetical protein